MSFLFVFERVKMLDRICYCVHSVCMLVILLHVSLHVHNRALSLELHHLTTALFESEYRRVPNNASALVTYSVLLPSISSFQCLRLRKGPGFVQLPNIKGGLRHKGLGGSGHRGRIGLDA